MVSVCRSFQDFRDDIERLFTGNPAAGGEQRCVDEFRRFVGRPAADRIRHRPGLALSSALLLAAIDMAFDHHFWRAHRRARSRCVSWPTVPYWCSVPLLIVVPCRCRA